jgi:dihydroxyacetone kinase-like predicted kinase
MLNDMNDAIFPLAGAADFLGNDLAHCADIIDGYLFRDMILSAAARLEVRKREIDELNVFPFPDKDTGANMSATMGAAGAVDAGGLGYTVIPEAMLRAVRGETDRAMPNGGEFKPESPFAAVDAEETDFCYCAEFTVLFQKSTDRQHLRVFLASAGTSVSESHRRNRRVGGVGNADIQAERTQK